MFSTTCAQVLAFSATWRQSLSFDAEGRSGGVNFDREVSAVAVFFGNNGPGSLFGSAIRFLADNGSA